jgi:hypothetical protein
VDLLVNSFAASEQLVAVVVVVGSLGMQVVDIVVVVVVEGWMAAD